MIEGTTYCDEYTCKNNRKIQKMAYMLFDTHFSTRVSLLNNKSLTIE